MMMGRKKQRNPKNSLLSRGIGQIGSQRQACIYGLSRAVILRKLQKYMLDQIFSFNLPSVQQTHNRELGVTELSSLSLML